MNKDDITPIQNEGKSTPETIINTKTKELIEKRIVNVVAQIMDSDNRIKEIESYRARLIIVKETLKDILADICELQTEQQEMKGNISPERLEQIVEENAEEIDDSKKYVLRVPPGDEVPTHTDPKILRKSLHPDTVHLPAEIVPFKEVPAFTYNKLQFFKQVGKIKVFISGENIVIYHPAYKINVFTSMDEIRRMKSLSELEIKLTITDYEKRTYQNKGVVLRHFLRELKFADELKPASSGTKPIRTFSKLSELDDIKKAST